MSLEALVAGAGDRAALEAEAERAATAVVSIGGMVGAKEASVSVDASRGTFRISRKIGGASAPKAGGLSQPAIPLPTPPSSTSPSVVNSPRKIIVSSNTLRAYEIARFLNPNEDLSTPNPHVPATTTRLTRRKDVDGLIFPMASPHEDRVLRDGQEPAPEEISLVANRGAWLKRSERSTTPESVEGQAASPSAATASPSTPPAEEEPVKERTSRVAFAPSPEPSESQSSAEASPEASPAPFISRANSNNLATSMVDGLMALEALQQLDGTFDEQPEPEMVDALES